jgi:Ca2+-dependent lipid-binding protein
LTNKSFVSLEHLDTSDHKPVRAEFELQLTKGSDAIRVPQIVQEYLDTNQAANILKNKLGVELVVSNMKGVNLAEMDVRIGSMGGLSDPYIVATTDPANLISSKKQIQSSTIKHNVNPVWGEEKLKIPLVTNDLDGLSQNGHLLLSVWDYDFSNDDDLIGLCRIPLENIVEAFKAGKPLVFNEPLYENGEIQGHLTGEISITGTYSKVRAAFDSSASTLVPLTKIKIPEAGFGCCSIA